MKRLLGIILFGAVSLLMCGAAGAVEPQGSASEALFPFYVTGDQLADVWVCPSGQSPAGTSGQVLVDGEKFLTAQNREEIRFWGVNTCFSMNFPDHDAAVQYAQRMARFGINAVRLHHMDNRDIWGKNYPKNVLDIDPDQLDRLDWFIYQLKLNGIYVNINLHVSRMLVDSPQFADAAPGPKKDKGVDNFEPRMVELQKRYAHDLLMHVNPYTHLAYTEDPCVAMIEINNENSVVASWFWGALDTLGATYEGELQRQWNQWLRTKYASTEALKEAWQCRDYPKGEELIQTVEGGAAHWHLENGTGSVARVEISEKTLKLDIQKKGTQGWNPQIYFTGLELHAGVPYTVKFRARALEMKTHPLTVSCSQSHNPWMNLGFRKSWDASSEWTEYSFTFLPTQDETSARLAFSGFECGKYEIADVSLVAGGTVGIAKNETLEDGSVRMIYRNAEINRTTDAARADFVNFLIDVETKYWNEMRRYIKEDLKAAAPVTGTQLNYGAHYAQGRMDYCDIHAYWNHPSFPGKPWDSKNWRVTNTALVNVLGNKSATVNNLANNRVLGRPYTVSEYNHPYPNLYGAEGFPMISSMAAFQRWNGIFIFAWSHSKDYSTSETPSFFDIKGNPVQLVHMAACYNLFVRGDVSDAESAQKSQKFVYSVTESGERAIYAKASEGYARSLASIGFCPENPLLGKVGVRLEDLSLPEGATAGVKPFVRAEDHESPSRVTSCTGQLSWDGTVPERGFYQVDTPRTSVFTGFPQGRTIVWSNGMKLEFGPTILGWATLSLTQTRENHWLLAVTGVQKNTNCALGVYDPSEVKDTPVAEYPSLLGKPITFCQKRGQAPLLCEGIPARLTFPAPKGTVVKYYPLDGSARRMQELTAQRVDDNFVLIEPSAAYRTLWYEIVLEP